MRIMYIKLVGFKRFALRESEVFEHHFERKLTMITGPNGAGKSSLFGELTPLPSDKNNFNKGGSKEIHITQDGKDYVLLSNFKDGTKYSFLCDGEELNASGNVTAQRDLAGIHFNVTPAVHDLMTGSESFTDMGLASRKKLFNSITHLNIDSILESYESLKEELKNNEYLVKTLQSRLLAEQQKLLDESRKEHLNEKLSSLHLHIEHLLGVRTELYQYKGAKGFEDAAQGFSIAMERLNGHYQTHLVRLGSYPLSVCDTIEGRLKGDLESLSLQLQAYYTEMERLLHEKTSIEFAQNADQQSIQAEVTSLSIGMLNLASQLTLVDCDTHQLQTISAEFNLLEHSLPDILETLPANPDRKLSKSAYADLVEEKNGILTVLHKRLCEQSQLQGEVHQLHRHEQLQCPACTHTWLPQEVKGLLGTTETRLSEIAAERARLEEAVKRLTEETDKQSRYLGQMHQLTALYSATKVTLATFWKVVLDKELIYQHPEAITPLVAKGIAEVIDVQKYRMLQERVQLLQGNLALLEVAGTSSFTENAQAIVHSEENILRAMQAVQETKDLISDVQQSKKLHLQLQGLKAVASSAAKTLQAANLKHTVDAVVSDIDAQLSLSKVSVIEVHNELGQHHAIEQTVKTLQEQVTDGLQNIKVLTILSEELSPKNGFIAKTISHFLNVVIQSVNQVIAGVWDYKMVLKPIDVENDNLNYRFKVEVEDRLTVDDISKASAGMKEMINLAMKITLFKLLKLENYPIFLDEFGVKLDASHRARVAGVIFKMLASPTYSQVFLITHLDLAYGNFKDTEIIEL